MAAQRLHLAAEGLHFAAQGGVHASHAADMQYMLHLAGQGWAARIQGRRPDGASWAVWGP